MLSKPFYCYFSKEKTIENKVKRINPNVFGNSTEHQAGWEVVLKPQKLPHMILPFFASPNDCSFVDNFKDVKELVSYGAFNQFGISLPQQSWLREKMEDNIIPFNSEVPADLCPIKNEVQAQVLTPRTLAISSLKLSMPTRTTAPMLASSCASPHSWSAIMDAEISPKNKRLQLIFPSSPIISLGTFCTPFLRHSL